jgi:exonuclease SbcD
MSTRPLRFIHAGDFLLHQPVCGLADVPAHLAERLIEAPYRAAERVFDAALAEAVDFLLLTGGLCDFRSSGPRGFAFLSNQFARLAEHDIAIYWSAGGEDCLSDWPASLKWLANVHVFPANRLEHVVHHRDGQPRCQFSGYSFDCPSSTVPWPSSFAADHSGLFAIAAAPRSFAGEANQLPAIGNNYWAFGGEMQSATSFAATDPACVVHCPGSPQGRIPPDVGPSGCTLVRVDVDSAKAANFQIHLVPIATDAVRWHDERLLLPGSLDQPEYERLLHERIGGLIAADPERVHLLRWALACRDSMGDRLACGRMAIELLAIVQKDYGYRDPPVWSASLSFAAAALPASWRDEQTLLGEFLRRVDVLESATEFTAPAEPDEHGEEGAAPCVERYLDCFLSDQQLDDGLADLVQLDDSPTRARVLHDAAMLGAELLAPSVVHGRGKKKSDVANLDSSQSAEVSLR